MFSERLNLPEIVWRRLRRVDLAGGETVWQRLVKRSRSRGANDDEQVSGLLEARTKLLLRRVVGRWKMTRSNGAR